MREEREIRQPSAFSPQPEEKELLPPHLCFSRPAKRWCSGVNPCPECMKHKKACVLEVALAAAGLDGAILADLHLFAAELARRGVDPLRLPGSHGSITLFLTVEAQLQAFQDGYNAGWRRLQDAMRGPLREMLSQTDLNGEREREGLQPSALSPQPEKIETVVTPARRAPPPRARPQAPPAITADDLAAAGEPWPGDPEITPVEPGYESDQETHARLAYESAVERPVVLGDVLNVPEDVIASLRNGAS